MGVHPLNRSTAHKTLQLLAVEEEPELHVIVEAAVVEVEHCLFTKDNGLLHSTVLLEICSCLITADEDGSVAFAHFTVMEYLTPRRIQEGPAAMKRHL